MPASNDNTQPTDHNTSRAREVLDRVVLLTERLGTRALPLLMGRLQAVERSVRGLPARLQRATNQVALLIELYDDYRAGIYREIPWRSIAVVTAALIYVISPIDLVPWPIPFVGAVDDALVIALTMRYLRHDLHNYCAFKGYDPAKYFSEP